MKKLLTLALVLSSATAFASRSRVTALGNSPHLVDQATVFEKPSDMMVLPDSVAIETGKTAMVPGTDAQNLNAEGLMIRSVGDSKFGMSLGHQNAYQYTLRGNAKTNLATITPRSQQNPLGLFYGMKMADLSMAGSLYYSNYNDKQNSEKESSMGVNLGVAGSVWDATVNLGLTDTWEAGGAVNDEYKGKTAITAKGGFWVSQELYTYAQYQMGGYKTKDANADVNDVEETRITVGAVMPTKKDGNELFWGVALESYNLKDKSTVGTKTTELALPVLIGLEVDAASWLTLRGSVTQRVLINDSKEEAPGGTTAETSPGLNTTTFAAGAGLKFNKITLDGSLLAGGSQNINGGANNLLGTVGLTYVF